MITQNIIGFQLSSASHTYLHAIDATSLDTLPEQFSVATQEETYRTVEKAYNAFRIYRKISGKQKADFLNLIANGIEVLGDILIARIMQETAYPETRIMVERNRTCAQLRMFAEIAENESWRDITIDHALPERKPLPRPDLRKMMVPIGPVVVFGASNFPLAYSTAGGDVASALAAGCAVIVKAHDSHLGTNALVAEVIMKAAQETGVPDGVFSSLHGNGFETAQLLVSHPLTAAVGFTGSLQGGKALFDIGQKRPKPIPVFAEMGSVNPVFLLPASISKDPESLASQLVASMTMTLGQFCTKPGILIALNDINTVKLIHELKLNIKKVPGGSLLNKGIFKNFHKGVTAVSEERGVDIIQDISNVDGNLVGPVLSTVHADVFLQHPNLHHEIFGPYSIIVLCKDLDQMKQVAEALEGQLTASVYMQDQEHEEASALVEILTEKAGRIIINGVPTGVEVCAAMTHGGPYPASTDSRFTAVGHHAIRRWIRPVTFQNFPETLWPEVMKKV